MKISLCVFLCLLVGCAAKTVSMKNSQNVASRSVAQSQQSLIAPGRCELKERKKFNSAKDKILIVGAGVSGLGVARTLIANNVPAANISIVEKAPVAGGKVSSFMYQGATYELGAQMIIPGPYHEIEKLRDEFGLTTRPLGRGSFMDVNSKQFGAVITAEDIPAFKEQIGRYLTMYATLWNQSIEGGEFHLLGPDGFKHIHPSLKKTWYEFVEENKFQLLNKALMSLLGGSGYAYRQTNPTQAALIVRVLRPELFKSLFIDQRPIESFNGNGYQELWKRIAQSLEARSGVTFYYDSAVSKITRNSEGPLEVTLFSKDKSLVTLRPDHVFYTGDLSYLPQILTDEEECETNLFQKIVHSDYRSYLVEVRGLAGLVNKSGCSAIRPYIEGIKGADGLLTDVFGQPVLLCKPFENTNTLLVYVHGSPEMIDKKIHKNIKQAFAQMGAKASVIESRKWKFFPRMSGDAETGYRDLLTLEGHGGLWLTGEIFSFAATHESFMNAQDFTNLFMQGKLGL